MMLGMHFIEKDGDFISTNAFETVYILEDLFGDYSVQCPSKGIDEIGFVNFESAKRFAEQRVAHSWDPSEWLHSNRELS